MASAGKRALCTKCNRPVKVCVCDALVEIEAPLELIIWQDPTEAKHKLSTAPLLHLNITNSRLLIADELNPEEVFSSTDLSECALLYPLENGQQLQAGQQTRIKKLLVLDGTWKKVRRLFHLNAWLKDLPYIQLTPESLSRYAIRKSPRADGLSTIEATVAALSLIDNGRDYQPVLNVLERMVELQQQNMPAQLKRTRS
ncbi:tRNA-uridine aminocarboxypropyltransferase [Bacterioplanoides sp.]|uniref:tRNA-uridine aminocarboxypropyltransferase n=1 Tax=Bacterioplanoides sp. TaxID=2066072 RepID=UPI003B5A560F